jgi:hypothetical protein
MPAHFFSRLMLSALAGAQGVAPLAIDLNRTHATHPLWPGHARFHVVWQSFAAFFVAIPEVALLWWPGAGLRFRFGVSAILIASSLLGFMAAAAGRRLYGGSFHDPAGIPPLRIRSLEADGNALAVTAGSLVLVAALLLFFFSGL